MTYKLPTMGDPLTLAATRLGEAKTKAAARGNALISMFQEIQREAATLAENGLSITTVSFDNKAIDAAWREFTTEDWSEVPMMDTEGELVARIRSVG